MHRIVFQDGILLCLHRVDFSLAAIVKTSDAGFQARRDHLLEMLPLILRESRSFADFNATKS
jgi:hypothetical protein